MPKVVCTLRHASESIDGYAYTRVDGIGLVSEEMPQDVADRLLTIDGFSPFAEEPPAPPPPAPVPAPAPIAPPPAPVPAPAPEPAPPAPAPAPDPAPAPAAPAPATETPPEQAPDELEQLRARAKELGINVSQRWSAGRLTNEIRDAESAKKADDAF